MQQPQRGEIFRLIVRGRVGTELRGKGQNGERFCMIVSDNLYNKYYPRLTVALLTSYTWEREYSRPLWSVTVQQANSRIAEADLDIDSHNADCRHGKLKIWETDEKGKRKIDDYRQWIPYKSIVDCGHLLTVWSFDPSQYTQLEKKALREVGWDDRHGAVKETAMVCVNSALQAVIDGGIRYDGNLSFREGDVLSAAFLSMDGKRYRKQCLVVSSSGIDAVRERIPAGKWGRLEQCTVVPLGSATQGPVHIPVTFRQANELVSTTAVCREIVTINWRKRNAALEGHIPDEDLKKV